MSYEYTTMNVVLIQSDRHERPVQLLLYPTDVLVLPGNWTEVQAVK